MVLTIGLKMLALLLLALAVAPVFTTFECGILNSDPSGSARVVGGRAGTYFKYPWFVSIHQPFLMDHQTCAGALISPKYVMTAAHCFEEDLGIPKENYYHVTLGIFSQCKNTPTAITYKISKVFVHEKFVEPEGFYDIALMKMDGTSELMPVCLPPKGTAIKHVDDASVVGFGRLGSGNKNQPCELNEATVKIFTNEECRKKSTITKNITNVMVDNPIAFCAGVMEGGVDTCQGDSGGSLLIKKSKRYFSMGIVSFGYGCADKGLPGIYTDVASYIDWINDKMDGELKMYRPPKKPKKKGLLKRLVNFAVGR